MDPSDHVDIIWATPGDGNRSSQPLLHQRGFEVQAFGTLRHFPIGLSESGLAISTEACIGRATWCSGGSDGASDQPSTT